MPPTVSYPEISGKALRNKRLARDMTQEDLVYAVREAGYRLSERQIRRLENASTSRVHPTTLQALVAALRTQGHQLMES